MRPPLGRAVAVLLVSAIALLHPSPAVADDRRPTTLTLTAPAVVRPGSTASAAATLTTAAGGPVTGAHIVFDRFDGDGWVSVGGTDTDGSGVARFAVTGLGPMTIRARFAGGSSYQDSVSNQVVVRFEPVASTLHIYGPARLVDETSGELLLRWSGADGKPVVGKVLVYQHAKNKSWSKLGATWTDSSGRARVTIAPRVDTWYQYRGAAGAGWEAATSASWAVDNRPPGTPVVWRAGTPRPLPLPAQRRAVGAGANVVAQTIPDSIWRSMIGKSWHSGCPVGRSGLRYLTVNYWGFDGYRHRGELVVRASAARKFAIAMTKLYNAKVPIRAMYLPDRFGKNGNAPGANDVLSMKHDNTSAFNCRAVTGDPGRRSPHSYGASIDMNPWENPFRSHVGWLPNSWWSNKQVGKYAWKKRSHTVVQLMSQAGFRWTYGTMDSQHFDG